MYINENNFKCALNNFKGRYPFDHCVIDDFFNLDIAEKLEQEFLDYEDERWFCYKNDIEDKKTLNNWALFPSLTYQVFKYLIADEFINILKQKLNYKLFKDPGLHGGGWHIHSTGGNLNPHLDYSIHPKLLLQRKLNIIIYLSSSLKDEDGGHLGLWMHDKKNMIPGDLVKEIQPKFNRAIVFDTTQNSWHGISRPLVQDSGVYRKSFAVYYLTNPPEGVDTRQRALFAAREGQKDNKEVEELIKIRADKNLYHTAYRKNK
jgi:hypothetical protein